MRFARSVMVLAWLSALAFLPACGGGKPSTLTVGGPGGQYETVAAAVAAARKGDIVSVAPGTYKERIEVKKDLQIVGQGKPEEVILTSPELNILAVDDGANLYLARVTVQHTGKKGYGVLVGRGSAAVEDCVLSVAGRDVAVAAMGNRAALTLRRSKILDCKQGCGVYAYGKATALVEENEISGCQYGLMSRSEAELTMRKNVVRGCSEDGIRICQDAHALIEDNTIEDCQDCAVFAFGPDSRPRADVVKGYEKSGSPVIVRNNRMRGNANGVCASHAVIETSANKISDCKWAALRANEASLIVSEGDELSGGEEGLFVQKGAEARLRNCTISGNTQAGGVVRGAHAQLEKCTIRESLRYGVETDEKSTAALDGCDIRKCQLDGINATEGSKIVVRNTKLTDNGGQGIYRSPDSAVEASGNTVSGSGSLECPGYVETVKSKWSREQRLWALTASAILDGRMNHRFDRLTGCKARTEAERINCAMGVLDGSWGINSREKLMETIAGLRTHGHHEDWQKMRTALERLTPAQRTDLLANPKLPDEKRADVQLYIKHGERLGDKGIKGFDLARCICLARWGHTVKFLTEEEAWNVIMPLAQQLRETFDSWDEFGTSYLVGRRFWSPADDGHDKAEEMYKELMAPGGSWTRYKWETDLTPKP